MEGLLFIYMIKLIDLIKEAKQVGILYHHTTYSNIYNIIKTEKLCSSSASYADYGYEEFYVICFTRDNQFHGNFLSNEGGDECRLVIDGDRLSNNYKIRPYAESEWEPKAEWEERITSEKQFCIPILKYIKHIDLLVEPEQEDLEKLIELCKNKGIKVNQSL